MLQVRKIELLAPAKHVEIGKEAILHGADAVYIGVQGFSARSAAGNSPSEIAELVDFAHIYHAKVYVALNILVHDDELTEVEQLIWDIYRAGADALIIQDLQILNLKLPPVALHASTQMDNRTVEKVQFLQENGFSQVVLARELSLDEIRDIANNTSVPLEVFVHGALCTSFSGCCNISQAIAGRSANRGECAQFCRLPYTLQDADGQTIASRSHLLSLKDLNLSEHLEELLDAGVSSFKIEGRLKDMSYVKNVTAYYRQKLDAIFARRPEFQANSSGETVPFFKPDPNKSFNRGFTEYFLHGRKSAISLGDSSIASKDSISSKMSPKSIGEKIGTVKDLDRHFFTYSGKTPVHNGDGLCFVGTTLAVAHAPTELVGFRVNRVDGNKLFPAEMPRLEPGTVLYRNFDHEFEKILSKKSSERKINIELTLAETPFGFSLTAEDVIPAQVGNNVRRQPIPSTIAIPFPKEPAKKDQKENIQTQLSKWGNTPFQLTKLTNHLTENWFIPSSVLTDMRQKLTDAILRTRKLTRVGATLAVAHHDVITNNNAIAHHETITHNNAIIHHETITHNNAIAHHETIIHHAIDNCKGDRKGRPYEQHDWKQGDTGVVMTTKQCLRHELGYCPRAGVSHTSLPKEPWKLLTGSHTLNLKFDCQNCEMQVIY
ncbi:MAG: U32 family peptidase [Candidatus Symbiothrix sp.]|jgi:putative protease|nr:U32 family peptidase [Candidatus Symbiothrix sp.]